MWQSRLGCVIIQCIGRNPERLLNRLRSAGIPVSGVRSRSRGEMELSIPAKDFSRLRPMVRETGFRVHILGRRGPAFLLYRLRRRPALWAGMLAMVALLGFLSTRFLWIQVTGCERIPEQVIIRALEGQGVRRYGALPEQEFLTVAARARMYDDRIAWISLEKRGATLIAKVTEHELTVPTVDPDVPCDVVAVKDGVVLRAEVYEGHSALKPGDSVSAGDVLIAGEFFPETNEEVLEPMRVHARGSILASVYYFGEYAGEQTESVLMESGESVAYRAVTLLGKTLYESALPYAHYEVTDAASAPLADCTLPFRLVTGVCRELVLAESPLTKAEQTERALLGAEQMAFLKIPKDAAVVDKKTAVTERDGVIIGVVGVVTEESIGLTREITA